MALEFHPKAPLNQGKEAPRKEVEMNTVFDWEKSRS
jgi:hypothetical protein